MFGYIQPYKNELKVKDVKVYKNVYCTLCNVLKRRYGRIYSFFLNYEVVFLYFFIQGAEVQNKSNYKFKCMINPFYQCTYEINLELINYAAFINIYLVQGKLQDNYNDEHSLISKFLCCLLNVSERYRQDCKKYSQIVNKIDLYLNQLSGLEKSSNSDIDDCSKTMGNVLKEIVSFYFDFHKLEIKHRSDIQEVAYILGQWIYIMDAYDDYEKDKKTNSFNPFIKQNEKDYRIVGLKILSLMHWNIKRIKYRIDFSEYSEIIDNILEYGLQNKMNEIRCREEMSGVRRLRERMKKWIAHT